MSPDVWVPILVVLMGGGLVTAVTAWTKRGGEVARLKAEADKAHAESGSVIVEAAEQVVIMQKGTITDLADQARRAEAAAKDATRAVKRLEDEVDKLRRELAETRTQLEQTRLERDQAAATAAQVATENEQLKAEVKRLEARVAELERREGNS